MKKKKFFTKRNEVKRPYFRFFSIGDALVNETDVCNIDRVHVYIGKPF